MVQPKSSKDRLRKTVVSAYLEPEQYEGLKRLSRETHIPMQVFVRRAIDEILAKYHVVPKRVSDEFLDHRLAGLRKGALK